MADIAPSLFAAKALRLDEVWWLVSPGNPLKPRAGMASLPARLTRARIVARRAPLRATAIEQSLGTRYTIDSVKLIKRRFARNQFIWLMGADNLAQFGQWKDWRGIARQMPIAVVARPGYDGVASGSVAMAWLRRFVRPARQSADWTDWRPPALVLLRFRPDPRSATLLRQAEPLWHREYEHARVRDPLTRRLIV
jgi:nicotinate-nucleotide adenylyltransferase